MAESLNPPYPVLSDPDLKVTKEYDTYNPVTNWAWPAAYIIDRNGVIQYAFRGASPPNTPPVDYILLKLTQDEGRQSARSRRPCPHLRSQEVCERAQRFREVAELSTEVTEATRTSQRTF